MENEGFEKRKDLHRLQAMRVIKKEPLNEWLSITGWYYLSHQTFPYWLSVPPNCRATASL